MQDFWLLNSFFLALGLIHISISLIFILSARQLKARTFNKFTVPPLNPIFSRETVGYNLLVSGLLISVTAIVILIVGKSISLLVAAVINLAITFISLRLNLFHSTERYSIVTSRPNETEDIANATEQTSEMIAHISTYGSNVNELNNLSVTIADLLPTPKLRVEISSELFAELEEIAGDPSAAVDEAIRWWLRRRLIEHDQDLIGRKSIDRKDMNSTESWRIQQGKWND
jgi:hypothetical protein